MRRHLATAAAVVFTVALLAGCATGPTTPPTPTGAGMTVEEAKAKAQQLEDDIVALIPADIIKTTDQLDKARLMSCTSGVEWPGSTIITFTEPQDIDAVVQKLHDDLDATDHQKNTIERVDDGDYFIVTYVTNDGTVALIAEEADDGTSIRIASASPCFELPDGSSRHKKY